MARTYREDRCATRVVHQPRVDRARAEAPPAGRLAAAAVWLKALGDPTRLGVLAALLGGEMCVCDLAAFAATSESAMSHQLTRLRDLGLVAARREGQCLFYYLADSRLRELLPRILDGEKGS